MLLDPLSLKRTVVSGLNSVWYDSGEKAGCTFHGHKEHYALGLHAQF